MTPTPVGMRCPECASHRTRVTRGVGDGGALGFGRSPATFVLIAINLAVFLAEVAGGPGGLTPASPLIPEFGLLGTAVSEGEWYRLLTGGFLHESIVHVGFNMVVLYFMGVLLEPAIGTTRFLFVYFASLFGGALGALVLSGSGALTIGASGAVFGIFGAGFVIARGRGAHEVASRIGILILINLAFSVGGAGHISLGGHLGGLLVGVLCSLVITAGDRGMLGPRRLTIELVAMTLIGLLCIVAGIAVA
jgi:membrane associated rhomboid family serine protease